MRTRKPFLRTLIFTFILTIVLTMVQLPYYVSTPGMAKELSPIIKVDGGFEEQGTFMLTTVRIGQANVLQYAVAHFRDFHHIYPEDQIKPPGESDEEYHKRQLHMMDTSKEAASYIAYKHAGKEVKVQDDGVYVMAVLEGMPAEGKLEAGDRVTAVDGKPVQSAEQLIKYVEDLKPGTQVKLDVERVKGGEEQVTIELAKFPDKPEKVGVGISLVTDREVIVKPNVKIDTAEIGGPSAGLMFSLEIYNQLTEQDLTHGLRVAGTGTMNYEGQVGPIGGIEQKIVAADKSEADIFFAPNEQGAKGSNYQNALKAAEQIHTDMKIVPVDTFEDAVQYLENLSKKAEAA
ncbi:SepM family pheromone-processing serine protease [Bacillus tianshenii]|nr:SepM family pheromone-processing serine protease [Bacillus tianshenii]